MTSEKAVAKKEKAHTSQRPKRPELIPVFISMKHLGVLLLPYPPASSPPLTGCEFIAGLPPSSMSPEPIYTPG